MEIVAQLMDLEEDEITDHWMDLYVIEISKCKALPFEPLGHNWGDLAEQCYYALLHFNKGNSLNMRNR